MILVGRRWLYAMWFLWTRVHARWWRHRHGRSTDLRSALDSVENFLELIPAQHDQVTFYIILIKIITFPSESNKIAKLEWETDKISIFATETDKIWILPSTFNKTRKCWWTSNKDTLHNDEASNETRATDVPSTTSSHRIRTAKITRARKPAIPDGRKTFWEKSWTRLSRCSICLEPSERISCAAVSAAPP